MRARRTHSERARTHALTRAHTQPAPHTRRLATQQELGRDQEAIRSLQMQLGEQNAKVDSLKAQSGGGAAAAPSTPEQELAMLKQRILQLEAAQQAK